MVFFGEASLAHQAACTLRDTGDLSCAPSRSSAAARALSAFRRRGIPATIELDARACAYLNTGSPDVTHPATREKRRFMAGQSFEVEPIAQVIGGRIEPTDDYWGGTRSIIRIDSSRFSADATAGLSAFSHLEIVFRFHLTDPTDLNLGARRPRDNPDWPEVGIFGHRNMRRLNWLGVSRCRLIKVDGLDLHVEELDAVDGTPVLDIKPWFREFGPRGTVRQAAWSSEMLPSISPHRHTTHEPQKNSRLTPKRHFGQSSGLPYWCPPGDRRK